MNDPDHRARYLLHNPSALRTSLGLDGDILPRKTRVMVAMSGGVDSTVTAALLAHLGHEVIGVTLRLYDAQTPNNSRTCCAGRDISDARQAAAHLNIAHYVFDWQKTFEQDVITPFVEAYASGQTPIPCVTCNTTVKFRDLLATARQLQCTALATGHYVRKQGSHQAPELHRGRDHTRDQSYFLFATRTDELRDALFPLGGIDKPLVRAFAEHFGLSLAQKPDSQDICFVPHGDYRAVARQRRPDAFTRGPILDPHHNVIGEHAGIGSVTIGQRRHIGTIRHPPPPQYGPWYVVDIQPKHNAIVVGPRDLLARDTLEITGINVITAPDPATNHPHQLQATVRVRSTMSPTPATICYSPANQRATVLLDEPQYGVASGQACVIYNHEQVWGGGWIAQTSRR